MFKAGLGLNQNKTQTPASPQQNQTKQSPSKLKAKSLGHQSLAQFGTVGYPQAITEWINKWRASISDLIDVDKSDLIFTKLQSPSNTNVRGIQHLVLSSNS